MNKETNNSINYDELDICIPTVSVVVERIVNDKKEILIQTRHKPLIDPKYTGSIEIPSGLIRKYESALDSAMREVKEETGLGIQIDNLVIHKKTAVSDGRDILIDYVPFCITQQIKGARSYINIGFVFKLPKDTNELPTENINETKNPRWINIQELGVLLTEKTETIFPINIPMLTKYYEKYK